MPLSRPKEMCLLFPMLGTEPCVTAVGRCPMLDKRFLFLS